LFRFNKFCLFLQSTGEFDKFTHHNAKYDIYGLPKKIEKKPGQDERNILKDNISKYIS